MQMVLEEVGTHASSMAIVDRKERTLWPCGRILLLRSCHVQDDGDSVFVIISLDTLMGISRITGYQTMWLWSKLRILKVFKWINWRNCSVSRVIKEGVAFLESLVKCIDDVVCVLHHGLLLLLYLPFAFLYYSVILAILILQVCLKLRTRTNSWIFLCCRLLSLATLRIGLLLLCLQGIVLYCLSSARSQTLILTLKKLSPCRWWSIFSAIGSLAWTLFPIRIEKLLVSHIIATGLSVIVPGFWLNGRILIFVLFEFRILIICTFQYRFRSSFVIQ